MLETKLHRIQRRFSSFAGAALFALIIITGILCPILF